MDSDRVDHPHLELAGVVLWPSFLAAALTVGIVFTLVDPQNVHLFGGGESISRPWAYTLGFFLFWLLYSATSLTSVWLHRKNHSQN